MCVCVCNLTQKPAARGEVGSARGSMAGDGDEFQSIASAHASPSTSERHSRVPAAGAQFTTGFTGTKVQILTQKY